MGFSHNLNRHDGKTGARNLLDRGDKILSGFLRTGTPEAGFSMIQLTRINHVPMVVNADLIEHIEAAPDTIISLTNGQKLVVLESIDEVVKRTIEFRRAIYAGAKPHDFTDPELLGPEPVLCPNRLRA